MENNQDLLVCALQNRIAEMEVVIEDLRRLSLMRAERLIKLNHTIAQLRTEKLLLESQVSVHSLLNAPDEDPHAGSEWTGGVEVKP